MGVAAEIPDLSCSSGLEELDKYLLNKTYISGEQASKDDAAVYCALPDAPDANLANLSRWYSSVSDILSKTFPGTPVGVRVAGSPAPPVASREAPSNQPEAKEAGGEEDDDDDLDLFGEETEEEKKAAAEREEKVKASGKKKESGKSSILLDVKPWDDETDMAKLEEAVRSVSMPGLRWGASKLVPVGFGIKKLQIMMTIEDDLVSVDGIIEDYLTEEPRNEFIQSCDIAAFNKI